MSIAFFFRYVPSCPNSDINKVPKHPVMRCLSVVDTGGKLRQSLELGDYRSKPTQIYSLYRFRFDDTMMICITEQCR